MKNRQNCGSVRDHDHDHEVQEEKTKAVEGDALTPEGCDNQAISRWEDDGGNCGPGKDPSELHEE